MVTAILTLWRRIPPPVQQWLRGAEVAVVTAIVSAFAIAPLTDFTTKTGIAKFVAGIGGAGYAAFRLYVTQSPVQNVVKQVVTTEHATVDDISMSTSKSETTTGVAPTTITNVISSYSSNATEPITRVTGSYTTDSAPVTSEPKSPSVLRTEPHNA